MSDSNSSVVSVVGILAIVILVGLAIYFFLFRVSDDAEIEIDIDDPTTEVLPERPAPMPVALTLAPSRRALAPRGAAR
jgi:hypothetical protein